MHCFGTTEPNWARSSNCTTLLACAIFKEICRFKCKKKGRKTNPPKEQSSIRIKCIQLSEHLLINTNIVVQFPYICAILHRMDIWSKLKLLFSFDMFLFCFVLEVHHLTQRVDCLFGPCGLFCLFTNTDAYAIRIAPQSWPKDLVLVTQDLQCCQFAHSKKHCRMVGINQKKPRNN